MSPAHGPDKLKPRTNHHGIPRQLKPLQRLQKSSPATNRYTDLFLLISPPKATYVTYITSITTFLLSYECTPTNSSHGWLLALYLYCKTKHFTHTLKIRQFAPIL